MHLPSDGISALPDDRISSTRTRQPQHHRVVRFVRCECDEDRYAITHSISMRFESHHAPGLLCTGQLSCEVLHHAQ